MFRTFTGSVKVACKVPYRYSKCSLSICKVQYMLCRFTGSVKVACIIPYRYSKFSCKVPYRYSKGSLNISKGQ